MSEDEPSASGGMSCAAACDTPLIYAHIGDIHAVAPHDTNARDLAAIVGELSHGFGRLLDFVYLPGDIADNGRDEEYALVKGELARLPMPVHVVPGDHDIESGNLQAFYRGLAIAPLPRSFIIKKIRCLCLDLSGPGAGGLDFQVGAEQLSWIERELNEAAAADQRCIVFMHTYPADLKVNGEAKVVCNLLSEAGVLLVDMGHTHYNEITNDGTTIFSATRSIGQVEEGRVGYSLISIDRGCVSWRFRELGTTSPQVLITSPSDRRLATNLADGLNGPYESDYELRVSVLADARVLRCCCRFDDGPPLSMSEVGDCRFAYDRPLPEDTLRIEVEAHLHDGRVGCEHIDLPRSNDLAVPRRRDGSDADRIDAWPERGILGSQLGPNRNGRQW